MVKKRAAELTSELFAQCKTGASYFLSLRAKHSLLCSSNNFKHPLLSCFIARWTGYACPQGINGLAPFSRSNFKTLSCDSRMATWIGDSEYLDILSIPSLRSFPLKKIKRNYKQFHCKAIGIKQTEEFYKVLTSSTLL